MKAENYARSVVFGKIPAPKYVKLQCEKFLEICEGKSQKYFVDKNKLELLELSLKLMIMPRGLKAGQTIYDCSCGYQWLFYTSVLCVVHRKNSQKRRYEKALLEIGRKNFKTFTIATIFILLFILEPKFSKFYSVAPDGSRSRLVKDAIQEILKSSPKIYFMNNARTRFKITRDYIQFKLNENTYIPLNYSNSSMDGRLPNVFLADEIGDLPNNYAIESMRSGQINILNKLGCIISTKYPTVNNPLEDEVKYAKQVLDGVQDDETLFALLFEPDKTENWMNDDLILKHANPVALEIPAIWEDLLKKRSFAIAMESARENFITKHCNIIYQGTGNESFIDIKDLQKCRINKINWSGREVYLGVDLSMTTDNTAIAMVSVDEDNKISADCFCFIPEGRIEEKSKCENIDYSRFIEHGKCFACGNKTIDYSFIEDYVFKIEEKFNCMIRAIGFDRYNCLSSAQKWNKVYKTVEIRQHSDTLHVPTKLLTEKIINNEFEYERNILLEINFSNAKCVYDTNMNRYIHKKKSSGKVDMVAALINAVYLLQQDIIFEGSGLTYAV
jgi:phage terminase large subunit-like protein